MLDAALAFAIPDKPRKTSIRAFARALDWNTGAGRAQLKRAASTDPATPTMRLKHRRRGPYTKRLKEYADFDKWLHDHTREDNARRKRRTFWSSIGPDGRLTTNYRECWTHIRFDSKARLAKTYLSSPEYRAELARTGKNLTVSGLCRNFCKCIITNSITECACPIHTQETEYLKPLF